MGASKQIRVTLEDLLWRRVNKLAVLLYGNSVGAKLKYNKTVVSNALDKISEYVERITLKSKRSRQLSHQFADKRAWHTKGHGFEKKRRSFLDWYDDVIDSNNCVYVFWSKDRCEYVGRTLKGRGRPANHFDKIWFSKVTRIDVLGLSGKRNVAEFECYLTHRFDPFRRRKKPSSKKHSSKCAICSTQMKVRGDIRKLFRVK